MLLFLLCAQAQAEPYESDTEDFLLEDFAALFQTSELDTGWVPKDGLLGVRFQVEAEGGATIEMEGETGVYWPDDLNIWFQGTPETGFVQMMSTLGVIVTLKFDIDIYSWEQQVANESVAVRGQAEFDPFVLAGGEPEAVEFTAEGMENTLFEYYYDVLAGVASVGFYATMQPQSDTIFEGLSWQVEDQIATAFEEEIVLPAEGQPAIDTTAIYIGAWSSDMDMVFVPTFQVCIAVLGCYDWDITELRLDLATERFEQAFPGLPLYYPLPVLDMSDEAYDFGQVEVGNLANMDVPLSSLGELPVEGVIALEGSGDFTVFPEYFLASGGTTDGAVLTFAPADAGVVEATLVITSNDPTAPELRIPIRGEGFIEGVDATGGNSESESEVVQSGCGCASAPGQLERRAPGLLVLLAGVSALVGRRRRQ